ncbi:uncharacterized protein LAJ45_05511 [Morchella importuna]|uniref:uncharacterized protein n=1 Tax=Morchella importuna TaxID=1174673 RepID=UPI001E8ED883|nr:uncharacterized protein LAJ45_05511 [Morchella importuna]KAH8150300.1 hypothetical protein LAJ45_05511 [Morchella importuna]
MGGGGKKPLFVKKVLEHAGKILGINMGLFSSSLHEKLFLTTTRGPQFSCQISKTKGCVFIPDYLRVAAHHSYPYRSRCSTRYIHECRTAQSWSGGQF